MPLLSLINIKTLWRGLSKQKFMLKIVMCLFYKVSVKKDSLKRRR